jgi:hypothetical protein
LQAGRLLTAGSGATKMTKEYIAKSHLNMRVLKMNCSCNCNKTSVADIVLNGITQDEATLRHFQMIRRVQNEARADELKTLLDKLPTGHRWNEYVQKRIAELTI